VTLAVSATASSARPAKPTAAAAIDFGTGFVDIQLSSAHLGPIQRGNGLLGFVIIGHFNKRKSSRAARVAVRYDAHAFYCPVDLKQRSHLFFTGAEGQISDKNLFHVISSEI
jgi:hypothetical protein